MDRGLFWRGSLSNTGLWQRENLRSASAFKVWGNFSRSSESFSFQVSEAWLHLLYMMEHISEMLLFSHEVVFNSFSIPVDCSPPGSSVHRIFPARILVWVAMSFSRESFQPRDRTLISCLAGRFFTNEPPGNPSSLMLSDTFFWIRASQGNEIGCLF